jgi:hypothetical protein
MSQFTINMAADGGDPNSSIRIIYDYLLRHAHTVKAIGMDIILGSVGRTNMDWLVFYEYSRSNGYQYDLKHNFWDSGLPPLFTESIQNAWKYEQPFPLLDSLRGYELVYPSGNGYSEEFPPGDDKYDWKVSDTVVQNNLWRLESLCDTLKQRNISLFIIIPPESPAYLNTAYYGNWAPKHENAIAFLNALSDIESHHINIHVIDENRNFLHDYSGEEAADHNHLNLAGAEKLTHRVDSIMSYHLHNLNFPKLVEKQTETR